MSDDDVIPTFDMWFNTIDRGSYVWERVNKIVMDGDMEALERWLKESYMVGYSVATYDLLKEARQIQKEGRQKEEDSGLS